MNTAGLYNPPPCEFGRVVLNPTVVSEGRQYDRLASLWLGDVEVWRTSTAEPKPSPGIVWTHIKDMTSYLSLWRTSQEIIFDLGNIVDDRYTGPYTVTLTATYFNEMRLATPAGPPADLIVPVSAGKSGRGLASNFVFPEDRAESSVRLPQNICRAVLTVAATG